MDVGRVCCSMKPKYEINFCFVKYQYNVHHSVSTQFETMGFTKLSSHNEQEHKNWYGCNRSLFLATGLPGVESEVNGIGFLSEDPDQEEKIIDLNGLELTILGERKLEKVVSDNYSQPITLNLQKSSIINTYGIIYECKNYPETLDYYKTNWKFEETRSTETTAILRSPNKRSFIKFVKSDKNSISTTYLGVENIRDLISSYVFRDIDFVDPGVNFNFNYELDENMTESVINNYKIALAGSRKNYVLETAIDKALPGVNFVFSERRQYNDISDLNYDKFNSKFS